MVISTEQMLALVEHNKHSPIYNYCLPGLTSWMLSPAGADRGSIRVLEATREINELIAPHSHRFQLRSTVLKGMVANTLYMPVVASEELRSEEDCEADEWEATELHYEGAAGKYRQQKGAVSLYCTELCIYGAGDTYTMPAKVIHSITFERGTMVLLEEGVSETETSTILQPRAYGKTVPVFDVPTWMFQP